MTNQDPVAAFHQERAERIAQYGRDENFKRLSQDWLRESMARKYVYNFDWMGRPIIQYPQDMVAMQELIWAVRPDLIIETGIAHGGSLALSASMLALLDMCDAIEAGVSFDPRISNRKVLGIDIDIREHNRIAMERHPMASRIQMIEGSSVAGETVERVRNLAVGYSKVMVCLDSNHTHDHVLAELNAYAPLVSAGSYCVVFDTFVEDMPPGFFEDRPWDPGNSPKTAVQKYLETHEDFMLDLDVQDRIQVTVAPGGFLRKLEAA
ncbi:cephalosporin hydroxylase family protein [Castellaniella sp. MT123]|uniref:cephalosporin hydroxylase family protein n=1 Tax=Castellaniella sp. MT123 TaxID=3140381 RepID=UPI0031F409DF